MKNSINTAVGASMEALAGEPNVRDMVAGKLGKIVKATVGGAFIAAALLGSAGSAMAAGPINSGCVVGSIAGGLLGNQAGGGNGKTALTALGAVVGCNVGNEIQQNSDQRRQQQAGYPNGNQAYNQAYRNNQYQQPQYQQPQYQQPQYQQPQYQQPQYQQYQAHPMSNYMEHTFSQLDGREMPNRQLTTQGDLAIKKALAEAENRMRENVNAQQQYANAYQQLNNLRMSQSNPENQVLLGSDNMRNSEYQIQNNLNQISRIRTQTNANFGSAGMRLADLVEYEAAQGFDIRPYGSRIMAVLSAPMSAPVSGFDPTTRQNVTFTTGNMMPQQPSQRAPGF